jgi:hypothetical protein
VHAIESVSFRVRCDVTASVVAIREVRHPALRLTVVLDDGTGRLLCHFLGRSAVPGIVEGRRLRVIGRAVYFRGRLSLLNPSYQFVDDSFAHAAVRS